MLNTQYLDKTTGEPTTNGSVPVIKYTDEYSNVFTYTVTEMLCTFNKDIIISGNITLQPNGLNEVYYVSPFTLSVVDDEFDTFVSLFGHNTEGTVSAIYPFIVNAIITKYELT